MALPALIDRLGGLARTAELKSHGFSPEIINAFVGSRKVIRICRGWYASPNTGAAAIAARRAGGRLACLSALHYHGVIVEMPTELHVSVGRSSSRLRSGDDVVLHWSRRRLAGDRLAVSIDDALRQAQHCPSVGWLAAQHRGSTYPAAVPVGKETMSRAILARQYGEPAVLEIAEVDVAGPGPGFVTIAVRAAGVNPADLKQLRGEFGRGAKMPLRLGSEIAGVVTAVGPDADADADANATPGTPGTPGTPTRIAVGDEVVAYRVSGGYSEVLTVAASTVLSKPSGLSWEQAAGLLAAGVTAFHLLEATGVTAGDRVLVHGASGAVGLMVVQLARLRGANVVGTAGAANQDVVRRHGAVPVSYGAGLAERVAALFPDGVDVALDTAGTDEAVDTSIVLVADRGRIASINAFARGGELGIKLLGSGPGADPGVAIRMGARAHLLELAGSGKLEVLIGATFPLARAAAALELLASGHPGGKIVLLP